MGDNGDNIRPEPDDRGEILSSSAPLGGAWQQVQTPEVPGNLFDVDCASPVLCVSGNPLGGLLVSTEPAGPSTAWPRTAGGGTVQITGVDCASASACVAVDNNADVLTSTDPAGGPGEWTFTNLIPYTQIDGTFASNAMWGVSCPSISFCAIAAADGQIFTSEDPFTPSATPVGKKKAPGKRHRGPKRPRTQIARGPVGPQEFSGRKFVARFRFYARGRASVRGFLCEMDDRRMRPCHSPNVFRVGVGHHRFRVRAIGWSGLKGPISKAFFRTCRPPATPPSRPLPPCWKGLPPPMPPVG